MKIRDKLEISTLKAKERQREIDEGAKIAKKIDVLRETSANEEAKLAKFREESMRRIRDEIAEKVAERNRVVADTERLRGEYESLRQKVEDITNKIKNL